eukprot:1136408-Pelagomonas_calceolata.AAC.1
MNREVKACKVAGAMCGWACTPRPGVWMREPLLKVREGYEASRMKAQKAPERLLKSRGLCVLHIFTCKSSVAALLLQCIYGTAAGILHIQ